MFVLDGRPAYRWEPVMRILRPLALFPLTLGLAVLVGDGSVEDAQQPTKQEKQLKRKMALEAAKAKLAANPAKPAEATPAKPVEAAPVPVKPAALGPIGPKDALLVAKMIDEQIVKKL